MAGGVPGIVTTMLSMEAPIRMPVSFEEFVAARLPALLRYGRVLTGDTHQAEDLVQTALTKAFGAWKRIESEDPEGYVRKVMANTNVSWWRRKPWRERPSETLPEGASPDAFADFDTQDAVWRALATLPPRQRTALVLRYYEGLSEAQIADTLGCRPGTVKSLTSRGLATLREVVDVDTLDTRPSGEDL